MLNHRVVSATALSTKQVLCQARLKNDLSLIRRVIGDAYDDLFMLPNFLIIGAPRSGTTWLEKNLRSHPDVFMPGIKELHFFNKHYDRGLPWYEAHFEEAVSFKAVGEATPGYLHGFVYDNQKERNVAERIKECLPDAKLIVSLRDPVERAYSRYLNSKARFDTNKEKSFEQQLSDSPEFIAEGMYFDQLSRYLCFFPPEQIQILLYDDLVQNPVSYMQKVYEFLGLRSDIETGWESVKVNRETSKGNLARFQTLDFLSRALGRTGLHGFAESVMQFNSLEQEPMSPETRRQLSDIYQEQNRQLAKMIGRDLSSWT